MLRVTLFLIIASATSAALDGKLVASFKSPASPAVGLDYYGGYLYHAGRRGDVIYITRPNGEYVGKILDPSAANGIERTGKYFYTTYQSPRFYRLTTSGSIESLVFAEGVGIGITAGGPDVYRSTIEGRIYRYTTKGSIIASFWAPEQHPGGLDFAGPRNRLFTTTARPGGYIYELTTGGSIVSSTAAPSANPYGITYAPSYLCYYLWCSDAVTGYVYQLKFSTAGVAPASLGRVKAVFR